MHYNVRRILVRIVEFLVKVWVVECVSAVDDHGWCLDAQPPGHLGALLHVASERGQALDLGVDRVVKVLGVQLRFQQLQMYQDADFFFN